MNELSMFSAVSARALQAELADITLGDLCRPQREEIAYAEQEDDEW